MSLSLYFSFFFFFQFLSLEHARINAVTVLCKMLLLIFFFLYTLINEHLYIIISRIVTRIFDIYIWISFDGYMYIYKNEYCEFKEDERR